MESILSKFRRATRVASIAVERTSVMEWKLNRTVAWYEMPAKERCSYNFLGQVLGMAEGKGKFDGAGEKGILGERPGKGWIDLHPSGMTYFYL